jgi:hypothetical protein
MTFNTSNFGIFIGRTKICGQMCNLFNKNRSSIFAPISLQFFEQSMLFSNLLIK